jgi:uncharacterized protein
MIPVLTLAFGLPVHLAIAVSLVTNIAVSGTAFMNYRGKGLVNGKAVMAMNKGSIPGIIIGALISALTPGNTIKIIFGIFLLVLFGDALLRRSSEEKSPEESFEGHSLGFSSLGLGMGFVSGLLGIGGGTIAVPAQRSIFKMPIRNAIANSLGTVVVSSFVGSLMYFALSSGLFSAQEALITAIVIVPGSVLGAMAGTRISERIHTKYLRYIFYVAILYIAINMIWSGMGW